MSLKSQKKAEREAAMRLRRALASLCFDFPQVDERQEKQNAG